MLPAKVALLTVPVVESFSHVTVSAPLFAERIAVPLVPVIDAPVGLNSGAPAIAAEAAMRLIAKMATSIRPVNRASFMLLAPCRDWYFKHSSDVMLQVGHHRSYNVPNH
jgi:hypothetical protein